MALPDEREVLESPKTQGTHEARAYAFDFTQAGVLSIASAAQQVLSLDTEPPTDVTSTVMASGAPQITGLVVTTTLLADLTDRVEYWLFCRVTHDGGQITELYCRIYGRR